MDYEKKYKDALEWARKVIQGKVGFVLSEVLEKFPELKENEDERVIERIKKAVESYWSDEPLDEILAWLEKQGEQTCKDEHKHAWSENDEIALGDALWCCKQAASIAKDENDMGNAWYAENWLISLKPQNTWKPSDEQMKALKESIGIVGELTPRCELLKELVEQLNELMEE